MIPFLCVDSNFTKPYDVVLQMIDAVNPVLRDDLETHAGLPMICL